MQLIYKALLLATILSSSAFGQTQLSGGNEVGNGGDVVVCRKGDVILSIELLDFYEAKHKGKEVLQETGATEQMVIDRVLNALAKVDTRRSVIFRERSKKFFERSNFLTEAKLADIQDSHHVLLPKDENCKVEQIVILEKASKKFLIDLKLWEKLSPTQKAGLIFHEMVYEYFADLGEKNSIKARAYNAFIFRGFSATEYWKIVRDLRIPLYK